LQYSRITAYKQEYFGYNWFYNFNIHLIPSVGCIIIVSDFIISDLLYDLIVLINTQLPYMLSMGGELNYDQ